MDQRRRRRLAWKPFAANASANSWEKTISSPIESARTRVFSPTLLLINSRPKTSAGWCQCPHADMPLPGSPGKKQDSNFLVEFDIRRGGTDVGFNTI